MAVSNSNAIAPRFPMCFLRGDQGFAPLAIQWHSSAVLEKKQAHQQNTHNFNFVAAQADAKRLTR